VRIKCYAEYGCQAIEAALDRELDTALTRAGNAEAALDRVRALCDMHDALHDLGTVPISDVRAALDGPGE